MEKFREVLYSSACSAVEAKHGFFIFFIYCFHALIGDQCSDWRIGHFYFCFLGGVANKFCGCLMFAICQWGTAQPASILQQSKQDRMKAQMRVRVVWTVTQWRLEPIWVECMLICKSSMLSNVKLQLCVTRRDFTEGRKKMHLTISIHRQKTKIKNKDVNKNYFTCFRTSRVFSCVFTRVRAFLCVYARFHKRRTV